MKTASATAALASIWNTQNKLKLFPLRDREKEDLISLFGSFLCSKILWVSDKWLQTASCRRLSVLRRLIKMYWNLEKFSKLALVDIPAAFYSDQIRFQNPNFKKINWRKVFRASHICILDSLWKVTSYKTFYIDHKIFSFFARPSTTCTVTKIQIASNASYHYRFK